MNGGYDDDDDVYDHDDVDDGDVIMMMTMTMLTNLLLTWKQEMEQVQRINASKEDELLQCHLLENKRLPKIMKNEGKTRALMFKQSLRISVMGITAEQEKERIKQVHVVSYCFFSPLLL